MKTIEERKNLESFWELIEYNKQCTAQEDWNLNAGANWKDFLRKLAVGQDGRPAEVNTSGHDMLKDIGGIYDSLLDVGCHDCSITREFKIKNKTGVDAFDKISGEASKHCDFKCMDARDIGKNFSPKSFDVVCELDFIEHLETIDEFLERNRL